MKLGKKKGTGYFSKCLNNVQETFAGVAGRLLCHLPSPLTIIYRPFHLAMDRLDSKK